MKAPSGGPPAGAQASGQLCRCRGRNARVGHTAPTAADGSNGGGGGDGSHRRPTRAALQGGGVHGGVFFGCRRPPSSPPALAAGDDLAADDDVPRASCRVPPFPRSLFHVAFAELVPPNMVPGRTPTHPSEEVGRRIEAGFPAADTLPVEQSGGEGWWRVVDVPMETSSVREGGRSRVRAGCDSLRPSSHRGCWTLRPCCRQGGMGRMRGPRRCGLGGVRCVDGRAWPPPSTGYWRTWRRRMRRPRRGGSLRVTTVAAAFAEVGGLAHHYQSAHGGEESSSSCCGG